MRNLAGDSNCNAFIAEELVEAGIVLAIDRAGIKREVHATIVGRIGGLSLVRGWYYWMVSGPVPLAVAEELYADPVGSTDVRVAGHAGRPPPSEWEDYGFVMSYHIDSQAGLNLFAATARRHGLDKVAA